MIILIVKVNKVHESENAEYDSKYIQNCADNNRQIRFYRILKQLVKELPFQARQCDDDNHEEEDDLNAADEEQIYEQVVVVPAEAVVVIRAVLEREFRLALFDMI